MAGYFYHLKHKSSISLTVECRTSERVFTTSDIMSDAFIIDRSIQHLQPRLTLYFTSNILSLIIAGLMWRSCVVFILE